MTPRSVRALMTAIDDKPAPCDHCRHSRRCADEDLTCDAFTTWVDTGHVEAGVPRVPRPTPTMLIVNH